MNEDNLLKVFMQALGGMAPPPSLRLKSLPVNPFGDVIEGVGKLSERDEGRTDTVQTNDEFAVLEEIRAARAERRKAEMRERITAALDTLGADTYDQLDVLRFTKRVDGRDWTYAAIKVDDLWYVTGRYGERHAAGVTWDDLTLWLVAGEPVTELTLMVTSVKLAENYKPPYRVTSDDTGELPFVRVDPAPWNGIAEDAYENTPDRDK